MALLTALYWGFWPRGWCPEPLRVDHWVTWLHILFMCSGGLCFSRETFVSLLSHLGHPLGPSVSGFLLSLALSPQRKTSSTLGLFDALRRELRDFTTFYGLDGVYRITPYLQLTLAFCSEWFAYLSVFWHLRVQIPQVAYLESMLGYILLLFSFNFQLTFYNFESTYFKACLASILFVKVSVRSYK